MKKFYEDDKSYSDPDYSVSEIESDRRSADEVISRIFIKVFTNIYLALQTFSYIGVHTKASILKKEL
jgi:hypothetical protein